MKHNRKAILLLVAIMLMGAMLTGCERDNGNGNSPTETRQERPESPPSDLPPPAAGGGPGDTNWVAPPYPGQ